MNNLVMTDLRVIQYFFFKKMLEIILKIKLRAARRLIQG